MESFMNDETGGPAFPFIDSASPLEHSGMTLRDYFAAKAMQGLIWNKDLDLNTREDLAELAYAYANVMLKVREQ
jgi:hypothetical protein